MLVVRHITHKDYKRILSDPIGGLFGNGPNALDFIEARCNTAHEESDTQDLEVEWVQISVATVKTWDTLRTQYMIRTLSSVPTTPDCHSRRGGGHTTMMTPYAARSYGGVGRAADLAFSSAVEKAVVNARGEAGRVVPSGRVMRLMTSLAHSSFGGRHSREFSEAWEAHKR